MPTHIHPHHRQPARHPPASICRRSRMSVLERLAVAAVLIVVPGRVVWAMMGDR
jgi:hypothetical protein